MRSANTSPELPQYERPVTIRHLLNHTSGLRDWGEIAALAGWPRETRVHTHDHVLDILSRQRALNYPPGDKYSYTNSGYNLLAIIVSRVSGQPFATFSRERLFKPLGLTSTQWRDDFRRIVKGRAQAYSRSGSQWELEMPFEKRPRQRRAPHHRERPAHLDGHARAPHGPVEAHGGLAPGARAG
jgi:CubicO group peptidase (beta-lactamase class C family)